MVVRIQYLYGEIHFMHPLIVIIVGLYLITHIYHGVIKHTLMLKCVLQFKLLSISTSTFTKDLIVHQEKNGFASPASDATGHMGRPAHESTIWTYEIGCDRWRHQHECVLESLAQPFCRQCPDAGG